MNFGSILTLVAILAAGIGILGVAFAFTLASQGRSARGGVVIAIAGFVAAFLLFIASSGILIIPPARVAVVVNTLSGTLEEPARGPGTSIIIPGIQEYVEYPTDQQQYTMSGITDEGSKQGNDAVTALTVDGQQVQLDITVFYQIKQGNVNQIHLNWQNRYEADFIRPTVRAVARDVVSQFTAEAIYGADREALGGKIEDRVRLDLEKQGLTLTSLLVRQIVFSPSFAASIEDKQVAVQRLEREKIEKDRVTTEAEGKAIARLTEARSEAESLRLISEQIAANPNLIQYLYVQNLSDNVQFALLPANSPFIFNASDFTQLGADFTAPEVPDALPGSTNEASTTPGG